MILKENIWQKIRVCSSVSKSMPAKTPRWLQDIPLNRSDWMIWVCPVFDDYDKAVKYMNWNKEGIREMVITEVGNKNV